MSLSKKQISKLKPNKIFWLLIIKKKKKNLKTKNKHIFYLLSKSDKRWNHCY